MSVYNACKGGLSALSQSLMLDASGADKPYKVIDFRPGDFNTNFAARMKGRVHWNGVDLREIMDRHHACAPDESIAIRALHRALLSNVSETVRTGDFFQSKIAPFGPRLLSLRLLRRVIRAYYKR
jgi:short-subunit dehydrogenase